MPAGEIETAVIDQLRGLLRAPEIVVRTWRAARQSIGDIKEADIRELQDAIEGFKGRGIGSFILGLLNLVVGLLLLTSPVSAALMVPWDSAFSCLSRAWRTFSGHSASDPKAMKPAHRPLHRGPRNAVPGHRWLLSLHDFG